MNFKISELRQHIKEVFDTVESNTKRRNIKLYYYCKGMKGIKLLSKGPLNLCDDKDCTNCRNFENILKEETKKL